MGKETKLPIIMLNIRDKTNHERVVEAIQKHTDHISGNGYKENSSNQEKSDLGYVLGSLWAQMVIEEYGWKWRY